MSVDTEAIKEFRKLFDQMIELSKIILKDQDEATQTAVPELVEEWSGASVTYKTGKCVAYQGAIYRCISPGLLTDGATNGHVSQPAWKPDAAFSEWVKIVVPLDSNGKQSAIMEWEQTNRYNAYKKGDKVSWLGKYYKSVMDDNADGTGANTWGPAGTSNEYIAGWEETDSTL